MWRGVNLGPTTSFRRMAGRLSTATATDDGTAHGTLYATWKSVSVAFALPRVCEIALHGGSSRLSLRLCWCLAAITLLALSLKTAPEPEAAARTAYRFQAGNDVYNTRTLFICEDERDLTNTNITYKYYTQILYANTMVEENTDIERTHIGRGEIPYGRTCNTQVLQVNVKLIGCIGI